MSLDRRIVSILYHNGIFDVEKIEQFIGEKNNYYEVMIDGEIKKLKIPGKEYFEQQFDNKFQEEVEKLKIKTKKSEIEETSFEKELEKNEIENKKFLENEKKKSEVPLEKKELEKKVIEGIEPKKSRTPKKLKIVESKKIDHDIDDFINTI